MKYLCFDIGVKRTGIAAGDDITKLVGPVAVIHEPIGPLLLTRMLKACSDHDPDAVVIGHPINMDDSIGPAAKKIESLADQFRQQFNRPVHLHDERLSTFVADEALSGRDLTHKQRQDRRDALAAAAILSDFFSHRTSP